MTKPERYEVHAQQDVLLIHLIFQNLLRRGLSLVKPSSVGPGNIRVEHIVIVDTGQVASIDPPLSEVLVPTGVERRLIIRIELDTKYGEVSRVSVGYRSSLSPNEYLN